MIFLLLLGFLLLFAGLLGQSRALQPLRGAHKRGIHLKTGQATLELRFRGEFPVVLKGLLKKMQGNGPILGHIP